MENSVWEISSRFAARGHEVTVLTSTRGTHPVSRLEVIGSLRVIRFVERYHLLEAPLIPRLALEAFAYDYDVMHVHGMTPTVTDLGIIMAKMMRKPVVVTYHNDIQSDFGGRLGEYLRIIHGKVSAIIMGMADMVVCTTESYGRTSPVLRHLKRGFRVIPVGVDLSKYASSQAPKRGELTKRLLFVGQLRDYKGVHVLLDALAELKAEGHPVKLEIIGTGPAEARLRQQTRDCGLDDMVAFRGNVDAAELPKRYAESDILVLPSLNRREAFGMVQLEARAAGMKVVASDMPGVSDVTRLLNGYLARPGDRNSLKRSILAAISDSAPAKRPDFPAHLQWENIVDAYESIFVELVRPG